MIISAIYFLAEFILPFKGGTSLTITRGGGEREEPPKEDGEHDVERDDKSLSQPTVMGVVLWDDDSEVELQSMIKIFGTPI